jgi:DNA/RNA-binding domain of Phe-tRNA-synthetase-like protein
LQQRIGMWIASVVDGTDWRQKMMAEPLLDDRQTTSIRRITDGGRRWRVLVETWQDRNTYHGRLVFRDDADDRERAAAGRESAPLLMGTSRNDVLVLAHEVPEERLRQVLHSLG